MELLTHYSNTPELLNDLRTVARALAEPEPNDREPGVTPNPAKRWSMSDRLTEAETQALIRSFLVDRATKAELADRYGISAKSVQRILRKHGARRPQHPPR